MYSEFFDRIQKKCAAAQQKGDEKTNEKQKIPGLPHSPAWATY
jgi:hypothetical protein